MQTTNRPSPSHLLTMAVACVTILVATSVRAQITAQTPLPKLTFTCATTVKERGFQYFKKLHTEIFSEMGYDFEVHSHDKDTALEWLRTEKADGDCGRHKQFLQLSGLNNIVRVEVPLRSVVFSLWQKEHETPRNHRKGLRVAYQRNLLFLRSALDKMHFNEIVAVESTDALIHGLTHNHFDAFIHYDTATELQAAELNKHRIRNREQVFTLAIHPYLLSKHADLLEEYTQRLEQKLTSKPFKPPHDPHIPFREDNQILFTCSVPENSKHFQQLQSIYRKAFGSLGYDFKMVSVPRARETAELKRSNISGSCGRAPSFIEHTPHVIGLDVKVTYGTLQIWSKNPEQEYNSLLEVPKGSSIAYVRGSSAIANTTEYIDHATTFVEVPNAAVGIKMLDANRVDFFIGFKANTAIIMDSMNIRNNLYAVGDLTRGDIHPVLTKQWSGLAERLNNELESLLEIHSAKFLIELPPPH